MLVLSRRRMEEIVVNDGEIVITVVEIRGDKVRIGVSAPKGTPIHRREIQDRIDNSAAKIAKASTLGGLDGTV